MLRVIRHNKALFYAPVSLFVFIAAAAAATAFASVSALALLSARAIRALAVVDDIAPAMIEIHR